MPTQRAAPRCWPTSHFCACDTLTSHGSPRYSWKHPPLTQSPGATPGALHGAAPGCQDNSLDLNATEHSHYSARPGPCSGCSIICLQPGFWGFFSILFNGNTSKEAQREGQLPRLVSTEGSQTGWAPSVMVSFQYYSLHHVNAMRPTEPQDRTQIRGQYMEQA